MLRVVEVLASRLQRMTSLPAERHRVVVAEVEDVLTDVFRRQRVRLAHGEAAHEIDFRRAGGQSSRRVGPVSGRHLDPVEASPSSRDLVDRRR